MGCTQRNTETCDDNICLLTQEPLTLNYITMPCGLNIIMYFCKEISAMKSKHNITLLVLNLCEDKHSVLIAGKYLINFYQRYLGIILPDKYVCSSTNYIEHRTCQHVFQSGKRKGLCCGKECI